MVGAVDLKLKATVLVTILTGSLGNPALASGKGWMVATAEARRKDITYEIRLKNCLVALEEAKKFGVDDPRYSESLRMLSQTHFQLLQFEDGERYVKEECALLEKMGDDYPALDYDYYWLGIMAETRGELDKANELMKKALVLCTKFLKPGQPTPQDIYAHLCAQAFAQEKTEEAKRYADLAAKFILARNKETESVEKIMVEEIIAIGKYVEQVHGFINTRKLNEKPISPGAERMLNAYWDANKQIYTCLVGQCQKQERPESEVYIRSMEGLIHQLVLSGDAVQAKRHLEPAIRTAEKYFPGDYRLLSDLYFNRGCIYRLLNDNRSEDAFKKSIHYKTLGQLSVYDPLVALLSYYENRRQFDTALSTLNSLAVQTEDAKFIHAQLGSLYLKLGTNQFLAGKREEALIQFKRSMEEFAKAKMRARYLFGAWQLAHCYLFVGNLKEAERFLKIVVASKIAGSFEDNDLLFRARQELALIYSKTGRESEAKTLSEQLKDISYFTKETQELQTKIKATPTNSTERRVLLSSLALVEKRVGDTLSMGGRHNEALPIFESSAKHYREALNMGLEYYLVQCALGEAAIRAQDLDTAEKIIVKAFFELRFNVTPSCFDLKNRTLNDLKRIYATTGAHAPLADALTTQYQAQTRPLIASIYLGDRQYRPDKAINQLEQLVAIDRKTFGDKSLLVKQDLNFLADAYFMARNYKRAQNAFKEFLSIRTPEFFTNGGDIPNNLGLAETYNRAGQHKEAEKICRKLMERGKEITGLAKVRCMQVLGAACILQGRFEEGRQLYTVARQSCPNKSALMTINRAMVRILESLRPDKAQEEIAICEDELRAYETARSRDSVALAFLNHELALAYATVGNTDKACKLLHEALELFKPATSSDLEFRLEWLYDYQRALRRMKKMTEANRLDEEISRIKTMVEAANAQKRVTPVAKT